jgi:putative MATE family efflux protein
MKDLSQGSIPAHIASMSIQMAVGLLVQVLYFFTDLYFVSKLGDEAIAGVSAAGTLWFVVLGLTQILSVGTLALVSHAAGALQRDRANHVFNQALLLAVAIGAVVIVGVYLAAGPYMRMIAADEATARAGIDYLNWFAPGLGLQFLMVAMFATLRATGMVTPTIILQMFSLLLNVALAPVLIVGWGTGKPMGTAGAGLASSIACVAGLVACAYYFLRHEKYVAIHREQMRVHWPLWGSLILIGLPIGLEFQLFSLVSGFIIWLIRDFGAAAQAGFGAAQTVIRIVLLPAMAVAFAAAPIAGQNFGARRPDRVRETFRWTVLISICLMSLLTVLCQFESRTFMRVFTQEEAVVVVGTGFLVISAWNFAANGVIFSCSAMFQALGNTWPSIVSSSIRVFIFIVPAFWLSRRQGFELTHVWYVMLVSMLIQAGISYGLVRREFGLRLTQ